MGTRVRTYPAGVPCHIVHRGVDRRAVFFERQDRERFISRLADCASKRRVHVHAYVLMDNHIHLLATPCADGGISQMMRDLGSHYVPRTNRSRDRTGALWSGRHYSTPITTDRYLLACYRYIEMNPVRARLVRHPGAFRWSSHRANAFGLQDALVSPHPTYLALAQVDDRRREAYSALFAPQRADSPAAQEELRHFRRSLRRTLATSDHVPSSP